MAAVHFENFYSIYSNEFRVDDIYEIYMSYQLHRYNLNDKKKIKKDLIGKVQLFFYNNINELYEYK